MAGIRIKGKVVSGSGYDSKHFNWEKFYPGTLNVMLEKELPVLNESKTVIIAGYYRCLPGHINGILCYIGSPEKGRLSGRNGVAIIAKGYLRGMLSLKDGDIVELEVSE